MDKRNFPDEIDEILKAIKHAFDGFGTNGFELDDLNDALGNNFAQLDIPWLNVPRQRKVKIEVYNPTTGQVLNQKQIYNLLHKQPVKQPKQILNNNQDLLSEIFKFCKIKEPAKIINSMDYSPRTNALILSNCKYTNNKIKTFIDKYNIDLSKVENPEMFLQVIQTSIDQNKIKI